MQTSTLQRITKLAQSTPTDHIWLVITVSKTDPESVEVQSVNPGHSILDAFSDQIITKEPDFFEHIDEDAVEVLYSEGFFENDDCHIELMKREQALNLVESNS